MHSDYQSSQLDLIFLERTVFQSAKIASSGRASFGGKIQPNGAQRDSNSRGNLQYGSSPVFSLFTATTASHHLHVTYLNISSTQLSRRKTFEQ